MEIPLEVQALAVARDRFGFESFRAGQSEVLRSVFAARDTLAVMPTGGGKSLCYVLPGLLLREPVLVVSPLIALMKDQIDQLRERGIPAAAVNSSIPYAEQNRAIALFRAGEVRLLFVAPERFRQERFLRALDGFRPSLFAVDEAHCISEWGHDFRPDYRRLRAAAEALGRPPILALTATATEEVRADIVRSLGMRKPVVLVKGFERPNLDFAVSRCGSREDKLRACIAEVERLGTGIVYAATRKAVEQATARLRAAGIRAGYYHAGMHDRDRKAVQERFSDRSLPVVVATNAFGMGIDRPDLRFVIHLDMPGSVEAYTQEAGRAGRDGLDSLCLLLHSASDARLQRFFIETSWPPDRVITAIRARAVSYGEGALVEEERFMPSRSSDVHPRACDSALRILEEAGVIERVLDRNGRFVRVLRDRPVDLAGVRARAERDYARLQSMIEYAERAGCHRAWLVDYFAGAGTASACGNCQGCRAESRRRDLRADETEVVLEALRAVRAMSGRYGRKRVAALLSGSGARDLAERGLNRSPFFGRLRGHRAAFLDRVLAECAALGLIEVLGGEYPVIALTYAGQEALEGRRKLRLSCFDENARSAPRDGTARDDRTGSRRKDGERTEPRADQGASAALRRWRLAQSRTEGVPAYRILHNRVLDAIAARRPRDLDELLDVPGIGPKKAERYGEAILRALGEGDAQAEDAPP